MEESSDITDKRSRRAFAKSVAAAFVVAPFALTGCDGDNAVAPPHNSDEFRDQASSPPVIITDGSLIIETEEPLLPSRDKPRNPKRKNKYELEGAKGKKIRCLTIKKDGKVIWCGSFAEAENCEISIYFDDCDKSNIACPTPPKTG